MGASRSKFMLEGSYGISSLLPAVIAISLALITRQVILSLLLGIAAGVLVLNHWSGWSSYLALIDLIVTTLIQKDNTQVVLFTLLVGSMVLLVQKSGGVKAFIEVVMRRLQLSTASAPIASTHRKIQLSTMLTSLAIFIETNIAIMTVGTLYRPLFDKLKIARERLAFIVDTCASPAKVAIPFNSWGVFIAGLIASQAVEQPFSVMLQSIVYNVYPLFILIMVAATSISGRDIGLMQKAQRRVQSGKLLPDNAKPLVSNRQLQIEVVEGIAPKVRNLLIPMLLTLAMVPTMLIFTGWSQVEQDASLIAQINQAINAGSGSASLTVAMTSGILVAIILYKLQSIFTVAESIEISIQGLSTMMTMAIVMLLAFVMGALSNQLGTGHYVAEATHAWLTPALTPALIFIVSCFVAFATGTSWGTFAIMIAIAIPLGTELDVALPVVIAAAVGGGIFGDHCSPISDTTIMSSMVSGVDHIDHVNTQLVYALVCGLLSIVTYLIIGFMQ